MNLADLNFWVALGTVGLQVGSVVLLALYFFKSEPLSGVVSLLSKYGILLGFLVSLAGIVLSLIYSELYGIVPCGLCWLARVFLYPQAVLFGIALWKKDAGVWLYSLGLSVLGAVITLYHHYLQIGGTSVLPCPAAGNVDCAKRFIFEFGYVTFPLVAFSGFVLLIILMLFVAKTARRA